MSDLSGWILKAGFLTLVIAGVIAYFERDSRNKIIDLIASATEKVDGPPPSDKSAIGWSGLTEVMRAMPANVDSLLRRSASSAALVIAAVLFSYGAAIGIVNEIRKPPAVECAKVSPAPTATEIPSASSAAPNTETSPPADPSDDTDDPTEPTSEATATPRPTPCILNPAPTESPMPSPSPTATPTATPAKTSSG